MITQPIPKSTVTGPEAFEVLGIKRSTGYRLIAAGLFPLPVIRLGHQIRIPIAALSRLLENGGVAAFEGLSSEIGAPADDGGSNPEED